MLQKGQIFHLHKIKSHSYVKKLSQQRILGVVTSFYDYVLVRKDICD
jgi:hypothetical protein